MIPSVKMDINPFGLNLYETGNKNRISKKIIRSSENQIGALWELVIDLSEMKSMTAELPD